MARLPLVDPDDESTNENARRILAAVRAGAGRDYNVFRAVANHPTLLEALASFSASAYYLNSLRPTQRELAYLTASVVNECHYWVPTHIALGRSVGLSEEQLAHLADEPLPAGVFDDAERAVVEYARRCTRMEPIDDDLFARLRSHLSLEQVMELCFTVGVANVINRFHATFLTDLDAATIDELGDEPPLPLPPRPDGPGVI